MKKTTMTYIAFSIGLILSLIFPHPAVSADKFPLKPVDKVALLELHGDNTYPVGKSDAIVSRLGDIRYTGRQDPPLAARGMGILVEITVDDTTRTILFDAGKPLLLRFTHKTIYSLSKGDLSPLSKRELAPRTCSGKKRAAPTTGAALRMPDVN